MLLNYLYNVCTDYPFLKYNTKDQSFHHQEGKKGGNEEQTQHVENKYEIMNRKYRKYKHDIFNLNL